MFLTYGFFTRSWRKHQWDCCLPQKKIGGESVLWTFGQAKGTDRYELCGAVVLQKKSGPKKSNGLTRTNDIHYSQWIPMIQTYPRVDFIDAHHRAIVGSSRLQCAQESPQWSAEYPINIASGNWAPQNRMEQSFYPVTGRDTHHVKTTMCFSCYSKFNCVFLLVPFSSITWLKI